MLLPADETLALQPAADVFAERFGEDLVVLNLATGRYFSFNASAGLLWKLLVEEGNSLGALKTAGGDSDLLAAFLTQVREHGLVLETASSADTTAQNGVALLASCSDPPQIEPYEDLADLILADPIHDVEAAAGWPNLPIAGPTT